MLVATSVADLRALPADCPRAVVMTMGALHAGHQSLMTAARRDVGADGLVIVTIFVNPLQFGTHEDLDRYPRTLDADLDVCRAAGVDVVFAPTADEMYPHQADVTIDPGPLADALEGAERPGHFRGVLTVVAKLLHMTGADIALFGEKDYQQLTLISRMVQDLNFPVRIVAAPTVREADGLAMSSRNRYLSAAQRDVAACVPKSLERAVEAAPLGIAAMMAAGLAELGDVDVDYFAVLSPDFQPAEPGRDARVLVAVRVGDVRLIDNVQVPEVGAP